MSLIQDLPKDGWVSHTEQVDERVGEFWHMHTKLRVGKLEVVSVDTRITPRAMLQRICERGAVLPRYLTVLSQGEDLLLTWVGGSTPEEAHNNHLTLVRVAIAGGTNGVSPLSGLGAAPAGRA